MPLTSAFLSLSAVRAFPAYAAESPRELPGTGLKVPRMSARSCTFPGISGRAHYGPARRARTTALEQASGRAAGAGADGCDVPRLERADVAADGGGAVGLSGCRPALTASAVSPSGGTRTLPHGVSALRPPNCRSPGPVRNLDEPAERPRVPPFAQDRIPPTWMRTQSQGAPGPTAHWILFSGISATVSVPLHRVPHTVVSLMTPSRSRVRGRGRDRRSAATGPRPTARNEARCQTGIRATARSRAAGRQVGT